MWSRSCQLGFRWLAITSLALAAGGVFYEQRIRHSGALDSAELQGRIMEAQRLIEAASRLDARQLDKPVAADSLNTNLPPGSAQVWLPELVKNHFTNAGIEVATVRLNSIHEIPESREFRRGYWSVGLPIEEKEKNIPGLLSAVAQFERQNAFIRVLDFAITSDPENPGQRIAGMNITTLIAK